MTTEVTFQRDDLLLHGKMYPAHGAGPFATVLLLPGSPGNEIDVLDLGQILSSHGYNVLTFNYSGTHKSGGLFSFANTQRDIAAAIAFLHDPETVDRFQIDASHVIIGGWSYGGGMALIYAANHSAVTATFSIAGTDHAEFMREYARDPEYRAMIDKMFEQYNQPGSPLRAAPQATPRGIFDQELDITAYDPRLHAPELASKQLLLIGGWNDLNVKIEYHIVPLYRALKAENAERVRIHALQDGHALSDTRDELAAVILGWLEAVI